MPIYEFTCQQCQHDFEALVRSDERALCPSCGGQRLDKRFSVPAAHTAGGKASLPICDAPRRGPCGMGGCGLPECG